MVGWVEDEDGCKTISKYKNQVRNPPLAFGEVNLNKN